MSDLVGRLKEEIAWHEGGEDILGRQFLSILKDSLAEIERLRSFLSPECPGCGLRPNLEGGKAIVWCDECVSNADIVGLKLSLDAKRKRISQLEECLAEAIAVIRGC